MNKLAIMFLLLLVGIIAIVILLRKLATKNRFFRWWWNSSFKIAACLPMSGWMARFIIGEEREIWIRVGEKMDAIALEGLQEKARVERENQARREAAQAKLAQEGYSDYRISDDGYTAVAYDRKGKKCDVTFNYNND